MLGLKIKDGRHILCNTPFFLAYEVLKSSNSFRISFIQADRSKYEILIR